MKKGLKRTKRSGKLRNSVSVVVPVYNNETILPDSIRTLIGFLSKEFARYQLVFVDDASTDGSREILNAIAAKNSRVQIIHHKVNTGQQQATVTGMFATSEEVVLAIDSDMPCEMEDLKKLWRLAAEGTELVLGCRDDKQHRPGWRRIGSRIGSSLFRVLYQYRIHDFGCSTAAVRQSLIAKFRIKAEPVGLLKLQILRIAESYIETNIRVPEASSSEVSGYTILRLTKLLYLIVLYRFRPMRKPKHAN